MLRCSKNIVFHYPIKTFSWEIIFKGIKKGNRTGPNKKARITGANFVKCTELIGSIYG